MVSQVSELVCPIPTIARKRRHEISGPLDLFAGPGRVEFSEDAFASFCGTVGGDANAGDDSNFLQFADLSF